MKKWRIFFISLILIVSTLPFSTANAAYNSILTDLEPRSGIILVQSLEDDTVIFDKNIHRRTPPASLTKIVTAILTLENCPDLNAMVTVPQSVIDSLVNTGSSNAGLKAGEEISVLDLLHCMLIPSANEAAATLADYVSGGSIDGFVDKMNVFVERLGCTDTHFTTPHGLDAEGQYTSAADMAKIMKYALTFSQSEIFENITSLTEYQLPTSNMHEEPRTIRSTNFLMNSGYADYYCKYVTGGKTGSTSGAGKCVVATASSGGYSYMAVIMNAPHDDIDGDGYDENGAFTDAKMLFEWIYKNIRYESILSSAEVTAEVKVRLSTKTDHLALVPAEDLYAFVPTGVDENSVLVKVVDGTLPESVDAPIRKGDKIAEAAVYYADQEIARADLVAAEDVSRNLFLFIGSILVDILTHPVVLVILGLLLLLVLAYIGFVLYVRRKDKKNRKKKNNKNKIVQMKDFK
ncbi:MAG: D-alanyl-D-alanine carboxypeptidase [Oscillospiraceae bacterium]|nr:D-alanyl-D-alanine carboxypeptidase [Oscillospiraceae bacterium]